MGKILIVASLIDDKKKSGEVKAFSFSNSIDGANSFLEKLSPFIQSLEIGMETTSNIFGKSSKEILMSISTLQDFENITADKLEKVLENITMKKFAKKKIDEPSSKATNSFGVKFCLNFFRFRLNF